MVISPHDIFAEILLPGILLLQPYSSYEWTKEKMEKTHGFPEQDRRRYSKKRF